MDIKIRRRTSEEPRHTKKYVTTYLIRAELIFLAESCS